MAIVFDAEDIQGDERRWLEDSLGQPLQEGQKVLIMAYTPGVVPNASARQKAKENLKGLFAKTEAHAKKHGITDPDIDDETEMTMRQLRGGTFQCVSFSIPTSLLALFQVRIVRLGLSSCTPLTFPPLDSFALHPL